MLYAGWEVRIVKMLPKAAGRGQDFQARGTEQANNMFIFSL